MFEMTYNEAKQIQEAQLVYYRRILGRDGIKAVRAASYCPPRLNPDEKIRVSWINEMLPRGGAIENIIAKRGRRPKTLGQDSYHWHNALRSGKVYH